MVLGFAVWEVGFRTFAEFMDGQAGCFNGGSEHWAEGFF